MSAAAADGLTWRVSAAGATGAAAGLALIGLGLLLGRPEVACVGAPLLLSMLWDWSARPAAPGAATVDRAEHGADGAVISLLRVQAMDRPGAVQLRVGAVGYRESRALVAVHAPRRIALAVRTARTGPHEMFGVDSVVATQGGAGHTEISTTELQRVLVLPGTRALRALPLPTRLQGLTGAHNSRRPGDGGDLRDVNLFSPGDRLRRIDWRVTARRAGQPGGALVDLYVRRDFATADAVVMLVVDSRDEVGPDVSAWSGWRQLRPDESTSLDIAREAAASLARQYLAGGDRVGLDDLGRQSRPVAPAGGAAQLRRLTHRLAVLAPQGAPKPYLRAPQVPSGSLVVLFSTFLDEEAARLAHQWRRAGHRVLAVDVLPELSLRGTSAAVVTAYRIISLERRTRMSELQRAGVELLEWSPGAAVDLAALHRIRAGHR